MVKNIDENNEKVKTKIESIENNKGFTKIPNLLLDNKHLFSLAESHIIETVIRKTTGWHKEWDRISFSQIAKDTGITTRTIQKSIAKLVEEKLLLRRGGGERKVYEYAFNMERLKEMVYESGEIISPAGEINSPDEARSGEIISYTKERYFKETIQKKDIDGIENYSIDKLNPLKISNSFKPIMNEKSALKENENKLSLKDNINNEVSLKEQLENLAVKMIKLGGFNTQVPREHQTKKFKAIVETLTKMSQGQFRPELDRKWVKDWDLKRNVFAEKYNMNELERMLKKAVLRYKKMWDEDYQPQSKKILTRDFHRFIYDSSCKKSWLMLCANRKPENSGKMKARKIQESIPEKDRKSMEKFYRSSFNELIYWKKMNEMYHWWQKNKDTLYWQNFDESGFPSYFGNWQDYFGHYVEYLKDWKDLSVNQLGIETVIWHKFNSYIEKKYGYELFPDEDKARMNKTYYNKDEQKNEEEKEEVEYYDK